MDTIERMARAICRSRCSLNVPKGLLDASVDRLWMTYRGEARAALRVLLEPSEGMIDAPRGLIMYFNSPPGESYPLGHHAESGGYGESYAKLLTDREKRMHSFPKAHQASLVFRTMIKAALGGK